MCSAAMRTTNFVFFEVTLSILASAKHVVHRGLVASLVKLSLPSHRPATSCLRSVGARRAGASCRLRTRRLPRAPDPSPAKDDEKCLARLYRLNALSQRGELCRTPIRPATGGT